MTNSQQAHIKTAIFSTLAVLFFITDRVMKKIILDNTILFNFKNLASIKLVKNYYIALSIPLHGLFLNILITIIIFSILLFSLKLIKDNKYAKAFFLTLVILGALSNLIDRILFGFVVDYISILSFPVFNIADSMICCGLLLFIINDYHCKSDDKPVI